MKGEPQVYHIIPHVGVGPVVLGMRREEVLAKMGAPRHTFRKTPGSRHETDAFEEGHGFQVFYGGDHPTVEYVELSRDGGFVAHYDGLDVFAIEADELVRHISEHAPFDPSDSELGYSYVFPSLDLSLWRPVIPGSPDDPDGRKFSTIGVGIRGYYSS